MPTDNNEPTTGTASNAQPVVKIGILGEQGAFEVQDTQARTTADSALLAAQAANAKFPASIANGGTGATTVYPTTETAETGTVVKKGVRDMLDIEYDLQVLFGIYEGRDLNTVFADEIADYTSDAEWFNARIIAGDFTGIRVFDYFDITLTDSKVFRYRVAAIDPYLHCMDTEITKHHIIMVPDQVWPDSVVWNTTNTNQGTASEKHPYLASNLHRWEINTFYALLPTKWKNVIATHRMLLEERYSTAGAQNNATSWSWTDVGKIFSLSETEVYGQEVWGTKGWSVATDCYFSDFFKYTKHRIRRNHSDQRYSWWLRSAAGGYSANACSVDEYGYASYLSTSSTGVRALPCFRVGV